jgi:DHA2 family multidrug resistance protein-like MFS transporter
VIALPCLLYSMDLTVLDLAVPSLSADLKPSSTQLLWIIDIYGFLVAGSLITMGTLGDRIGRRRLLLIGAAAFAVASVLAAFSTSARMLIATRALLGLAGATLAPSTLSLIRNMFVDPRQRSVAVGAWVSSYSAGAVIGPPLGGFLLQHFWWGSVFLLSVPMMALLLTLGPILLPEFRDPTAGRPDLPSAFLSVGAVLGFIYGLKQFAVHGVGWLPALAVGTGLLLGAVFVRRQRKLADPLIDLRLFRTPAFSPVAPRGRPPRGRRSSMRPDSRGCTPFCGSRAWEHSTRWAALAAHGIRRRALPAGCRKVADWSARNPRRSARTTKVCRPCPEESIQRRGSPH